MSTRADILPDVWVTHLLQLQDQVPAKPFSDVHATLMEELGEARTRRNSCGCGRKGGYDAGDADDAGGSANMIQLFEKFDEKPLGTASIAQVHRALLVGGEAVVVKVQHRGVEDIILQDLDNAVYLVEELAKSKPEYDFRDILSEWCAETKKELDFIHEADNTDRVAANLQNLTGVKVPRVIRNTRDGFLLEPTRRVLILEYMDGVKPNDTAVLGSWGIQGEKVMERLSAAFAHQIFIDGLFNGDPHPGNMLIERGTGTPVLLDFGLVKELPTETRVAFCRLVLAAAENDFTGLLQALREMGLSKHVSLSRPEEAMDAVRFMFRDAAPDNKQRQSRVTNTAVSGPSDEHDDSQEVLPRPCGGSLPTFPAVLHEGAAARRSIKSDRQDDANLRRGIETSLGQTKVC
jgi:aarF domain-containing kinase